MLQKSMAADVVMYTTHYCGYCRMAARLLAKKGVTLREIDAGSDPSLRRWLVQATGQRTVPQIFVNGRSIGGYDELAAHESAGNLDRMLAERPPPPSAAQPPTA
jgi:glutaredoxin 3